MTTKSGRANWREWVGLVEAEGADIPLLTRRELIALAERFGAPVDERTLRYWETEGVLPRPTRDHTAVGERARYPWWAVDLVWQIRQYKHWGLTLEQLRQRMPAEARRLATLPPPERQRLLRPLNEAEEHIAALLGNTLPYAIGPSRGPGSGVPWVAPIFNHDLRVILDRLADSVSQRYGIIVTDFSIEMKTVEGERLTITLPPIDSNSGETPVST